MMQTDKEAEKQALLNELPNVKIEEVAQAMGVSTHAVRKWIKRGISAVNGRIVRLEGGMVGHAYMTRWEWVREFQRKRNAHDMQPVGESPATYRRRVRRDQKRAAEALA